MTGTIVGLAVRSRTGVIQAEDGSRLAFAATAVLGDFDALAVGHRVSFDVDRARPHGSAVTVLREPRTEVRTGEGASIAPDLRYLGFLQEQNVRSYRFGAVVRGTPVREFVVTVDMSLMIKHHVGIQEIPALCLRKLLADIKGSPEAERHFLDDGDLGAFVLSRAAAERKKPRHAFTGRRGSPPPAPSADRRAP